MASVPQCKGDVHSLTEAGHKHPHKHLYLWERYAIRTRVIVASQDFSFKWMIRNDIRECVKILRSHHCGGKNLSFFSLSQQYVFLMFHPHHHSFLHPHVIALYIMCNRTLHHALTRCTHSHVSLTCTCQFDVDWRTCIKMIKRERKKKKKGNVRQDDKWRKWEKMRVFKTQTRLCERCQHIPYKRHMLMIKVNRMIVLHIVTYKHSQIQTLTLARKELLLDSSEKRVS